MPFDTEIDASDGALLVAFANGDPEAARVLISRLSPRIMGHAMRLLGNRSEAEDVLQEAMLRLWRVAPDWRQGEAKVTTWLYRIVANLCIDRRRKKAAIPMDDMPEMIADTGPAEAPLQEKVRLDALQAALNVLPSRQRQAVVLRHIELLSNPEIAEIMEISTEAVESLIARGRRGLGTVLGPKKEELGYQDV